MENFWNVGNQQFARSISGKIYSWGAGAVVFSQDYQTIYNKELSKYDIYPLGDFQVGDWYYSGKDNLFEGQSYRYPASAFEISNHYARIKFVSDHRELLSQEEYVEIWEAEVEKNKLKAGAIVDRTLSEAGATLETYYFTISQVSGDDIFVQNFWAYMR